MSNDTVILLVEDNPKDEELAFRAFKQAKIVNPVVVARDGVEALDYLFARGAHAKRAITAMPQVIFLDLKLPKISGFEVLKLLRLDERTKLLPIVILTGSVEEQDLIQGYSLGANSYVRKPVDFVQFVEAVQRLGLYWLLLNETAPLTGTA
ncbi:MAG: response regulator [Deltaproteobacteria bacterium]|nr:response regulator [Deltaproteobacteria bacterium]